MSTRSSIVYTNDAHIYSETNEPQFIFGNLKGYNIHVQINSNSIISFRVKDDYFYLDLITNSEIAKIIGTHLKFWGGTIEEIEYDTDSIELIITGGTHTARKMEGKDFAYFQEQKAIGSK